MGFPQADLIAEVPAEQFLCRSLLPTDSSSCSPAEAFRA